LSARTNDSTYGRLLRKLLHGRRSYRNSGRWGWQRRHTTTRFALILAYCCGRGALRHCCLSNRRWWHGGWCIGWRLGSGGRLAFVAARHRALSVQTRSCGAGAACASSVAPRPSMKFSFTCVIPLPFSNSLTLFMQRTMPPKRLPEYEANFEPLANSKVRCVNCDVILEDKSKYKHWQEHCSKRPRTEDNSRDEGTSLLRLTYSKEPYRLQFCQRFNFIFEMSHY
jgi:hypothetical protein